MKPDEDTMNAVEELFARPDAPDAAVSPWRLERYLADDLSPPERAAVADALRSQPGLKERLAALQADDAAFLAAHPFEDVLAGLKARAVDVVPERRPKPWRRWVALMVPLAAALALLVLPSTDDPARSANRLKGGGLIAMQLVEGVAQPLSAGEAVEAGTRIQFRASTVHPWMILVGVDGTGTVSRYEPVGGELSAPIAPGQGTPLADSLVLDGSPGPEVFVAVFSDEPMLVEEVEQALHDVVQDAGPKGALDVGALDELGVQVSVFWVEKRIE
jgi:anti-sigma factor RsiW